MQLGEFLTELGAASTEAVFRGLEVIRGNKARSTDIS